MTEELCNGCNLNKRMKGHLCCKRCIDAANRRAKRNIKKGMCISHPDRKAIHRLLCQKCLDKRKQRNDIYKKGGMCTTHPNVPCAPNHVKCQECVDYFKRYYRQNR